MSDIEHEIEAKINVSAEEMQVVFDALSKDAVNGKIKKKHRPRAYFDTKKRRISKAKMALRVQHKDSVGYEQTLKYEVASDDENKMSRIEVKNTLGKDSQKPDLSLIDLSTVEDKNISGQIKSISSKKLEHVFTASVKRRFFVLPVENNGVEIAKVELAFDVGEITHAKNEGLVHNVSEIEVELKSGDALGVDIMCEHILSIAPNAYLSSVSKAEAGYRLDSHAKENEKGACISTKHKLKR